VGRGAAEAEDAEVLRERGEPVPERAGSLVGLECLQVKISPPGLNGLALHKLEGLKELELSKALRRPSVFPLLSEIAQLKCLTKLSVSHFSIRYVVFDLLFGVFSFEVFFLFA